MKQSSYNFINIKLNSNKMEKPSPTQRPKVMLFHRYPPEFELIPCPGLLSVIKGLSKKYELIHFGMTWNKPFNNELRQHIAVKKYPLIIDITSSFDKWFKTFFYYLYLPICMLKIRKEKPAVLWLRENFPFVPYLLSFLKIPIIIEIGDWWPSMVLGKSKKGKKIAQFIEEFEVKLWKTKNIICLIHTNAEKDIMINRGIPNNRILRVTLPMAGGIYSPYNSQIERQKLGFSSEEFVVAVHGIIHPTKGYDQLLDWWKNISLIHQNFKLLIIGGTIGEEWCKNKIKELGIEKSVVMTGWIFDQNILNKYLNAADCLLVTRRNSPETWGNTPSSLTHSLLTGVPVLTPGLPGILEVVTNKNDAFAYKPDSYESFKESLEFIYKNPKKAKEIGKKGLARVNEYFGADKMIQEYLELLESILKNKNKSN
jgi:glycosyltransferase involved in cell wall biosynthesis